MSEPIQVHTGDGGVQAQILVTVTNISTDVAVMKEQLKAVPDHETRIRSLEAKTAKMIGAGVASGVLSGGMATIVYWALSHH